MVARSMPLAIFLGAIVSVSGCASQSKAKQISHHIGSDSITVPTEAHNPTVPPLPADALLAELGVAKKAALPASGLDRRFDVTANEMDAKSFFTSIFAQSAVNAVVDPAVSGSITLSLRRATLEEILQAVRDMYGFEYQRTSYGYKISPLAIQTRMFEIDYLDIQRTGQSQSTISAGSMTSGNNGNSNNNNSNSNNGNSNSNSGSRNNSGDSTVSISTSTDSDFWKGLAKGLEQIVSADEAARIVVNPHSGIVVVTAMPKAMRQVEQFIAQLEASVHRQVILEAKIIEVTLTDGYQTGINWASMSQANGGNVTVGQGAGFNGLGTGSTTLQEVGTANAFSGIFGVALDFTNFNGFIEMLQTQGEVQVLSSPRVSTLNNQKAVIKVGQDEFFVTGLSSSTTSSAGGVTNSPSVGLTPFFSGIALDVTPQVSNAGNVTLHIHPSVTDVRQVTKSVPLGDENREVPLATSRVRESDSVVRAANGQVVVIGGLMESTIEEERSGVPLLSEIPLVGNLFRHNRQSVVKKELVILLRPIVVDESTWRNELTETQQRIKALSGQGLNTGYIVH